jgi:glycine/serine hydroxymethyltransferase
VTTRGMYTHEMTEIADIIDAIIHNNKDKQTIQDLSKRVDVLCERFPVYS